MIRFFLNRPVSLTCIYLIILLLGAVSITRLPVEKIPEVEYPSIIVRYIWNGASPEMMERRITSKVEAAVYKLKDVRDVLSRSKKDECEIEVTFNNSKDLNYKRVLLLEELNKLEFPEDMEGPFVEENLPEEFRRGPNFILYITGDMTLERLSELANEFKFQIMMIKGVEDVNVFGDVKKIINIRIKNEDLNIYDVFNALDFKKYNAGKVVENKRDLPLQIIINERLNDLYVGGKRLEDISEIYYELKEPDIISRINGNPQITINISRKKTGNTFYISRVLKKLISNFERKKNVKLIISSNEASEIFRTIKEVILLGIISIISCSFILFIFYRKMFVVFVFFISILFSAILTFSILYFLGFSLNFLTLSGICLGFGMLVDNSIVVLENILRLKEEKVKDAEEKGAKDVFIAVFGATLTTIAVYFPFLYFQGKTKVFYIQFAVASTISLLSSMFVSFTLIPSLSRKIKGGREIKHIYYEKTLKFLLKWRWIVITLSILAVIVSFYFFKNYVYFGEFYEFRERNELFIYIRLPRGSERKEVIKIVDRFEEEIKKQEGVQEFFTNIYSNQGNINVKFKKGSEWKGVSLKERLENLSVNYANCRIIIYGLGPVFFTGSSGISSFPELTLRGYDWYVLKSLSNMICEKLRKNPRIDEIDPNFSYYGKQMEYILNVKDDIYFYNLNPYYVFTKIKPFYQKEIEINNRIIPVKIFKDSIIYIDKILNEEVDKGVYLREITNLTESHTPPEIERENRIYKMDIAYLYKGPWKSAYEFKKGFIQAIKLPPGFTLSAASFYREEEGISKKTIIVSIIISIFLLFLILSSTFESLINPFLIIFLIPFSFIGITIVYIFTGNTFDTSSFVGLILFTGIAVNSGIVLIDHLSKGDNKEDEIIRRSSHRLRPIMTTSLTTIAGLFPFLFLKTEGILFSKLSLTTIGGLILSTICSIFILPVIYYSINKKYKNI